MRSVATLPRLVAPMFWAARPLTPVPTLEVSMSPQYLTAPSTMSYWLCSPRRDLHLCSGHKLGIPPPSLPSPRTLERGTVPIHQNHQQARSTFLAAPSPMVFVDARSLPVDGQRVGLRGEPFTLQADRVIGFRSCCCLRPSENFQG